MKLSAVSVQQSAHSKPSFPRKRESTDVDPRFRGGDEVIFVSMGEP